MSLVAERQLPDPPVAPLSPATTTPRTTPPAELAREFVARSVWKQGVIGSINVLTAVLAVRLILMLATLGAFALAFMAIRTAQPMQLGAMALYLAGVVLPLTWLASRR